MSVRFYFSEMEGVYITNYSPNPVLFWNACELKMILHLIEPGCNVDWPGTLEFWDVAMLVT